MPTSTSDRPTSSPIPFDTFARLLLVLYEPPLRARATATRMAQLLGLIAGFPGVSSTSDLTTPLFAAWIADRSQSVCANTVIGEIGYLRTACEFAVEEGYLSRNPFTSRRLRVRKAPTAGKSHHTLAEVSRVLAYLRDRASGGDWKAHRLYALAATVAYTGVRRNEGLYLRPSHVDLVERIISIVPCPKHALKTLASAAPVPVADELAEVLADWIPECGGVWLFPTTSLLSPWTGGNPGTKPLDRLKQAGRAVGVEGLTWKSLRHSWATHAETAWGLSDPAIQRVLRHTTPFTSRHYRHADLENLRAMVRTVSYRAGAEPEPAGAAV